MVEFIIMIIILVICGLLFGKADTKKEMLNWVGLDLSERNYMNKKGNEFHSYSIKAMKAVVDLDYYDAQNEMDFLDFMYDTFDMVIYGRDDYPGERKYRSIYLGVNTNYSPNFLSCIFL